jgi:hypothetical protein
MLLLASSDPFNGIFPTSVPTFHDNASPTVTSFFTNIGTQILTLFSTNIDQILLGVGIWAVLLVAGFFADAMFHTIVRNAMDKGGGGGD